MSYTLNELFEILLSRGPINPTLKLKNPEGINQTFHGVTLLQYAITTQDIIACKYLIENGADVNTPFYNGQRYIYPLEMASLKPRVDIILLLIENGAHTESPEIITSLISDCFHEIHRNDTSKQIFDIISGLATKLKLKPISIISTLPQTTLTKLIYEYGDFYSRIGDSFKSLVNVEVTNQILCEESITWLARFIVSVGTVERVTINHCCILDEHVKVLLGILGHASSIKNLNLNDNNLSDKIMDFIIKWIHNNRIVVQVSVDNNTFLGVGTIIRLNTMIPIFNKWRNRSRMDILCDRRYNENSLFSTLALDILVKIFYLGGLYTFETLPAEWYVKKRKTEEEN